MSESVFPTFQECYYTPLRDALRLRFNGRLNWQATLNASQLPGEAQAKIRDVVAHTRLLRMEKAAVCDELIAHFEDGIRAGASYQDLLKDFGDSAVAATLISRGKKRNRSMFLKIGRAAGYCGLGLIATYICIAIYFFLGRPNPSIDFLQDLNVVALNEKEENKAWPIYREAWIKYNFVQEDSEELFCLDENDDVYSGRRLLKPTDPEWPQAVQYLRDHEQLLAAFRLAAKRPVLGLELKLGYHDYDSRDLQALFPDTVDESGQLLSQYRKDEATNPSDSQAGMIEGSVMGVLLPHVQSFRAIARLMVADSRLAVEENDPERAIDNIRTIFGAARHAGETPILVCGLVSLAIQKIGLQQIEELLTEHPDFLSNEQLEELQTMVAQLAIRETIKLDGERAMMYDILQWLYTDDGDGDGRMTSEGVKALPYLASMASGSRPENPAYVKVVETVIAPASVFAFASRKQMREKIDEFVAESEMALDQPLATFDFDLQSKLEAMRKSNRFKWALLDMFFPAVEQVRVSMERTMVRRDAVELAIAVNRFRRQTGEWPSTEDQLVPTYIETLPVDPLTGGPLHFAIVDGQLRVYSVGNNLTDDEGQILTYMDTDNPVDYYLFESFEARPFDGDWILWPSGKN